MMADSGLKTNSFITFLKTTDGTIYAGSVSGLYQFNTEDFIIQVFSMMWQPELLSIPYMRIVKEISG